MDAHAPAPMRADELAGFEADWLGCDGRGHVALFTTAGGGFVPASMLADAALHEAAVDALAALPERTVGTWLTRLGRCGRLPPWRDAVRRGLFAYDAHPNGGPYRRCGVPRAPVAVADLPELVQRAARSVWLHDVDFATRRSLGPAELVPRAR